MYFNLHDARVFHFMGMPGETRHIIASDKNLVISPGWSIHSGVGTGHHSFAWSIGGENQEFADMDPIALRNLV
jgi:4-deoxy-L-threo-5-hexosulose-uronate ketol-isomerase